MEIIYLPVEELIPYENNPRVNDKAVKGVIKSIQEFGFKVPIVVDGNGVVICGHTRLKASLQMGLDTVPCIVADDLTEAQVKAFRLADNKTAEAADWDEIALQQELVDLAGLDFDMSAFGFELQTEEPEAKDDDYDANPPEQPKAKPGDIYLLGNHRLMCGDSTNYKDVQQLCAGTEMDLLLTDPPYNVDYEGKAGKIENDSMSPEAFMDFLTSAFNNAVSVMRAGAAFYIWHSSRAQREFENALNAAGLQVREQLIWNKNAFVLGRQDYQWKHEPCFYGWKDGAAHYFINDRTNATVTDPEELPEDLNKLKKSELVKLLQSILELRPETTVLDEHKPKANDKHPTMKPIPLIGRQIKNSAREGEAVLDLFGGSGSTLIAAEQLGRRCFMMEYDPKFVDVIIDRWERLTDGTAELLDRKEEE